MDYDDRVPTVTWVPGTDPFRDELLCIYDLHAAKRSDYTAGGHLLANYQFSSSMVGLSTHEGMLMRLSEKLFRIKSLNEKAKRGEGIAVKDESIEDTYRDIATIAILSILNRRGDGPYAG